MQYGIEKQLAINIANGQEAKTKKFFDEYVVNVDLPNGTTIQQPLSQFDVNSEAFDKALTEFQSSQLANTRGIRASLIREHILPKQNLAIQKVFSDQETKLAESKIKQASVLFNDSVLNSWFSIDNYNDNIELNLIDDNYTEKDRIKNNGLSQGEFLALEELQDNVDSMVNRGLATAVSPSKMIGQVKTNVLKILDYYESNNLDMDIAYEEVEEYINWIGNLKVGPKGTGNVEILGATNPGAIQLNCEANTHGIILQSPAHSAGQSYTIKFPTGNITAGTFLKVDSVAGSGTSGVGQLTFDSSPATTGKAIAMAIVFG